MTDGANHFRAMGGVAAGISDNETHLGEYYSCCFARFAREEPKSVPSSSSRPRFGGGMVCYCSAGIDWLQWVNLPRLCINVFMRSCLNTAHTSVLSSVDEPSRYI
jgi:hypothetical protein